MNPGVFTLSSGITLAGFVVLVIGVLVTAYLYGISKLRQSTADLQAQANAAQEQIIEAMQVQIKDLQDRLDAVQTLSDSQADQIIALREQVTHAAKVDALTEVVALHTAKVDEHFGAIETRLKALQGIG